jgi:hypothetical protein
VRRRRILGENRPGRQPEQGCCDRKRLHAP